MATIEIEKFVKTYGPVRVLHEVDLAIEDGAFVVLLGPSGCGKSTMLRMIAGLEAISGGTLRIDGRTMNDVHARDRDIAMVFQNYALYPHMNVYDNIAFGLRRLKVSKPEIDARVRKVADLLAIGELLSRRPRALSGGQQQRVAMARAMIKTPKVFLFDEPLSNLDAKLREQLRVEVKKLHLMLETTTVFVTHDQLEAMSLADKIVVMRDGRVEQIGTPRQVYYEPASLFVARFIGTPTINLIPMRLTGADDGLRAEAEGLAFPVDPARHPAARAGQEVIAGVRPRDLRLVQGGVPARVELAEMMGGETLLQAAAGPHELLLLVDDRDSAPIGAAIEIAAAAPDAVHLFDTATERSLRAPG